MLLFVKNLIFTVLVPGTVGVYIPLRLAMNRNGLLALRLATPQTLALPLLLAGSAIYLWCLWDFAVFGRGTPAPIDAPKHLVVRGLYKFVRNPMYVGVVLMIVGWAVFFRLWVIVSYGVGAAVFFHLFVILIEEPILRNRFGESYARYCEMVGRWIPRSGRRTAV
jgi:protein-S-isoprenylcysteine O-methyltransferase Ste14